MSDLETEDRKLREDSLSQVEVAKKALHKNPCNTQWLIKCPLALRKLTTDTSSSHEVHESLKDAKTKLEKVLETHQHDHEAKFQLGMVYYHILKSGKYHGTYEEFFKKTIEYFKDVKDMVPEAYNMLDLMKSYLPSKSDEEQDCNVDNLTRQGQKLFWSSCLARDGDEKIKLNKEAIEKFSAALLLEPDDILVKLQLATARMRNCDVRDKDGKAEYERFLQECSKLEEERRLMAGPLYMDENEFIRRGPINNKKKEKKKRVPIAEQCSHHKAPTKIDTEAWLFRGMRTGVERLCNPVAMLPHMANGGERFGIPAAAMQPRPMANGGTRYRILVPLTRLLLHKLISRK